MGVEELGGPGAITRGPERTFWGDGYAHYFDRRDGFIMSIYISKIIKLHA